MDFSQGRRVIGDPGFQSLKISGNTEGTFFCSFCGEKFHQREKFKQHKEQELAKLPASSEAVLHQPSIMPAPSRSQLSPTDFRSSTVTAPPSTTSSAQCNIVGPQDHRLSPVSVSFVADCSAHAVSSSPIVPSTCSTTTAPPKTTSSFSRTFFCPDCGEVFHQVESFKQHKAKELSKKNAISAASAAANSASAAAKFAEQARDSSVKALAGYVSAAASADVAARVKDFSAKATSLSLLSVPSVSVASSYFASDSAASNPVGSTSTNDTEGSLIPTSDNALSAGDTTNSIEPTQMAIQ